jgi:hypothetical protein
MPHANKVCIRRKLIIVTIKQRKPNGLWQAGVQYSLSILLQLDPGSLVPSDPNFKDFPLLGEEQGGVSEIIVKYLNQVPFA